MNKRDTMATHPVSKNTEKQLRSESFEPKEGNSRPEEQLSKNMLTAKALLNSEKRYRRLFESAKDGILILEADTGKVVDVNPFLLKLLGFSYDEMAGQYLWEFGVFKDIAASKDAFKVLQDNEYIRYDDLPLETRDGHPIEVEFVSNVYMVDLQKVIQCNIRDITARKSAEKALVASEAKSRNILDNIGIGVFLISPAMEILELNRQMRAWFPGVDPGRRSLCYQSFGDLPRKETCESCPTVKTLRDGAVHEGTIRISRAGVMRNYRIVSSPILNDVGDITAVIEMVEDITERLCLEAQFRQAQKMESVGRLAGGVAHDYNNMLGVILGYAELALEKSKRAEPVQDDLQEIFKAAKRSSEVTRQLLGFARKQPIAPRIIDLNQTIEGMLKMLRRLLGEDVRLVFLPGEGIKPLRMDPSQLNQILANLCVNARDAITDVGKITIETNMVTFDKTYCDDHAGFTPGNFVLLALSDDGCGMDKETQGMVFEPFFTTKKIGDGTGLGLSTVYGIVKQNEGFINVYSEPGVGTIFRIYLQYREGDTVRKSKVYPSKPSKGHGETILVVEDEISIVNLVRIMLKWLGYKVLTAGTPDAAIQIAERHAGEIHLLLTDVVMPGMNGQELSERLMLIRPKLKRLFMSGYTADAISHRGVLNDKTCFIKKPFSRKELADKVREALERRSTS